MQKQVYQLLCCRVVKFQAFSTEFQYFITYQQGIFIKVQSSLRANLNTIQR